MIIVHHCGHEGRRPRGHSSLIGALDTQIAVKRDEVNNVIATVELMKDGTQGDEFASRLKVIELGADDGGDKITSCVVEATNAPINAPKTTKTSGLQTQYLAALETLAEGSNRTDRAPNSSAVVQFFLKPRSIWHGDASDRFAAGLRKADWGKTPMVYNGKVIGSSDQPEYAAARWLLGNGAAFPDDRLETYRDGKLCMSGIVGKLAKWTVIEHDDPIKHNRPTLELARWRPFPTTAVGSPAATIPRRHNEQRRSDCRSRP